ncbi:hypothetical protein ACA910_003238 [Epithemia clementina (nom. ined.)]
MVNFSTAFHRLARHSLQPNARAPLLKDPRFALLVAALAESMIPSSVSETGEPRRVQFKSRELSNTAWGLAKLRVVPPASALPLQTSEADTAKAMADIALEIRKLILESAKARQTNKDVQDSSSTPWVPLVSKLSGMILDYVRFQAPRTITSQAPGENSQNGFQQQEVANLLWAWATSGRGEEAVFGELIALLIENQKKQHEITGEGLTPQEWSNSIWATATAGIYCNHDKLLEFVATSLEEDRDFVARFKPQEISNTLWGVATLLSKKQGALTDSEQSAALRIERVLAKAVVERSLADFKTQEVTNMIWSLATLGFGLEPSEEQEMNNYVVLISDDLKGDQALLKLTIDALIARSLEILPLAKPQELNNVAWSLARLVDVERKSADVDKVLWTVGKELSDPRKIVAPQDIGTTLWSFATLSFIDTRIYRAVASRLVQLNAEKCKPQELSNTLWAVATAEMEVFEDRDAFDTTILHGSRLPEVNDPIVKCFGIAALELMRRPEQFKTQEIKDTLWSFSKVGIRHPRLFQSVAEHLVGATEGATSARGLHDFSPQGIGNLAWAFARQAQMCEDAALRLKGSSVIANTNGRLAVYTTSYFDVGENLLQRLFLSIAETGINAHKGLSILKPQDLSNTAWTFAILGLRHEAFAQAAIQQLKARLDACLRGQVSSWSRFKGQEIANLLWALATLNVPVGDLVDTVSAYIETMVGANDTPAKAAVVATHFKRQELANIAWSCAVFGTFSKSLMLILYSGLLGRGSDRDPQRMNEIYGDGGLQSQEVMTLIYVQLALAQKGFAGDDLSLPPDFPGEWQNGSEGFGRTETDKSMDLSLTTSSLQQIVSDAFNRIGFDHCQEHVISMKDLSEEYGISLLEKQSEVLSIDIANVKARIAIEVDGPAHYVCQIDQGLEEDGYAKLSRGKLEYQFRWNGKIQRVNGPTALKHRLLEALGWKVISIPFWEWSGLDGDMGAEDDYCRRLLESHL